MSLLTTIYERLFLYLKFLNSLLTREYEKNDPSYNFLRHLRHITFHTLRKFKLVVLQNDRTTVRTPSYLPKTVKTKINSSHDGPEGKQIGKFKPCQAMDEIGDVYLK